MTESNRIAEQLRRSYEGHAWHGPSLKEVLDGIDESAASRRPIAGAHSIWELTLHMTAWASACRHSLIGNEYISLEDADDWPAPQGSWSQALDTLEQEMRALIQEISNVPDDRLDQLISEPKGYSTYVLLHGVVQHNLYHAGQIALLKKQVV